MVLKFKLLVFIIFFILNNYFTQDYHQRDLITYDTSTITFLKKNLQPVNGIVYCDHGEIGNFIQGKREGRHKEWFENGQLRGDWNFENGLAEGFIIRRYDNWYKIAKKYDVPLKKLLEWNNANKQTKLKINKLIKIKLRGPLLVKNKRIKTLRYVVNSGDRYDQIIRGFGVSKDSLIKDNKLKNKKYLTAGDNLIINQN